MVDFQLKLQDNKVAEWSDRYMNYGALKKILKKATIAEMKYIDLCLINPARAEQTTKIWNKNKSHVGEGGESFHFTLNDKKKMNNEVNASHANIGYDLFGDNRTEEDDDDDYSLDTRSSLRTIYSQDDLANVATEESTLLSRSKSVSRFSVRNALGNISGLFSIEVEGAYDRKLENALQDRNDQIAAFDTLFHNEQKSVKSFYYDTLDDLEEKFEFMRESVARAFGIDLCTSTDGENFARDDCVMSPGDRHCASPFITQRKHHRKTLSVDAVMGGLLQHIVGEDTTTRTRTIGVRGDNRRKTTKKITHNNTTPHIRNNKQWRSNTGEIAKQKSHRRRVTNVQLGDLLQDDDDDEEELHFQSVRNTNNNSKQKDYYVEDTTNDPELEEKRTADAEMIKRFLILQYRTAKYLQNYAMLNIIGFVKITKKFDKNIPSCAGKYKSSLKARNMMDDAEDVEALIKKYEIYHANWFCEGDVRAAKVQMLSKQGDGLEMDWSQLQLGYRMGVCAVLAVWVCWDCVWGLVKNGYSTIGERAAFPIFRACGGLLLLQWFWACSVSIWTRYRINYIYLFDFVPSTVRSPFDLFCAAVDNTLVFMILMLLYYKAGSHDIPQIIPVGVYPLLLICCTIWKIVYPLRQRRPLWQTIAKVISAPLHSPTFFQTYVGDVLTSIVKILQDIAWSICWIYAGNFLVSENSENEVKQEWSEAFWYKSVLIPLIIMMPLVIRFNQCLRKFWDTGDRFPHLANATKYVSSLLVTLFGIFHPLYLEYEYNTVARKKLEFSLNFYQIFWTILFVVSSIYSFIWDVYMDWGLGREQYSFLNHPLMYPQKFYYHFAIGIDLILRFIWVSTLIPADSGASFALPEYLTALTMMLELSRRTMWGFFRLENEHRNNEHKHQRAGFVPLHFESGHKHMYQHKKERAGSEVLQEVIFVTLVVGVFCFATIAAAQHANERFSVSNKKEL